MYNANKTVIEEYAKDLKEQIDAYRQENTNYKTFEAFAQHISEPSLRVNEETKKLYEAYLFLKGNPFEKLALKAFTIVPGDSKATKALGENLKAMRELAQIDPANASYFNTTIDSRMMHLQSSKPNVVSLSLADRLETALQTIAEKVSVS